MWISCLYSIDNCRKEKERETMPDARNATGDPMLDSLVLINVKAMAARKRNQ